MYENKRATTNRLDRIIVLECDAIHEQTARVIFPFRNETSKTNKNCLLVLTPVWLKLLKFYENLKSTKLKGKKKKGNRKSKKKNLFFIQPYFMNDSRGSNRRSVDSHPGVPTGALSLMMFE